MPNLNLCVPTHLSHFQLWHSPYHQTWSSEPELAGFPSYAENLQYPDMWPNYSMSGPGYANAPPPPKPWYGMPHHHQTSPTWYPPSNSPSFGPHTHGYPMEHCASMAESPGHYPMLGL